MEHSANKDDDRETRGRNVFEADEEGVACVHGNSGSGFAQSADDRPETARHKSAKTENSVDEG